MPRCAMVMLTVPPISFTVEITGLRPVLNSVRNGTPLDVPPKATEPPAPEVPEAPEATEAPEAPEAPEPL